MTEFFIQMFSQVKVPEASSQAHESVTPIRCIGELRKKGKIFCLSNHKNFSLSDF